MECNNTDKVKNIKELCEYYENGTGWRILFASGCGRSASYCKNEGIENKIKSVDK